MLMEFESNTKEEFEMISGTQMRNMAKNNEEIPEWFMNGASWQILKDYYQN
jgi:ATP sulfurylase